MSVNKIAIRTDTAANWTAANPTLVEGEQGHESDTGRRKIGDGSTAWNSLPYIFVAFPVGYQYTMYAVAASNDPDVAFPSDERPDALFGGTWELLWDDEGVFFRTEGTGTTADNDGRVDGLQADQMQRITGETDYTRISNDNIGAFRRTNDPKPSNQQRGTDNGERILFNSANSPDARASATTAGETRPVNRLFRIYRRTA